MGIFAKWIYFRQWTSLVGALILLIGLPLSAFLPNPERGRVGLPVAVIGVSLLMVEVIRSFRRMVQALRSRNQRRD